MRWASKYKIEMYCGNVSWQCQSWIGSVWGSLLICVTLFVSVTCIGASSDSQRLGYNDQILRNHTKIGEV